MLMSQQSKEKPICSRSFSSSYNFILSNILCFPCSVNWFVISSFFQMFCVSLGLSSVLCFPFLSNVWCFPCSVKWLVFSLFCYVFGVFLVLLCVCCFSCSVKCLVFSMHCEDFGFYLVLSSVWCFSFSVKRCSVKLFGVFLVLSSI